MKEIEEVDEDMHHKKTLWNMSAKKIVLSESKR